MATLLMYRLLEMIEQRRLSRYNLFVSDMNYLEMQPNLRRKPELETLSDEERLHWLKEKVFEIKNQLFRNNRNSYLPEQVSLLEGFIILEALGDPITRMREGENIFLLRQIRNKVVLRNYSIFAHGLGPVDKNDYEKFRDFVLDMFKKFCGIEKISFNEYSKAVWWLNPLESKNYISGKEDK